MTVSFVWSVFQRGLLSFVRDETVPTELELERARFPLHPITFHIPPSQNPIAAYFQMSMNPAISIECGEQAPPIFFCVDCVDMLPRHRQHMVDVLKPLQAVSVKCENKVTLLLKLTYVMQGLDWGKVLGWFSRRTVHAQRTRQCARAFHWSASQRTASGRCAIATPVTRENMCRVEVRTMSSTWPSPMCGQVTPKRKGIWPRLSWGLYSEARNTRMFEKIKKMYIPHSACWKKLSRWTSVQQSWAEVTNGMRTATTQIVSSWHEVVC